MKRKYIVSTHFLCVLVLAAWALGGFGFSSLARGADQIFSDSDRNIEIPGPHSFETWKGDRLMADALPDTVPESTRPELSSSGLRFGQDLRNSDGTRLFVVDIGPEWVEDSIGLRLSGSGTLYSPLRRYGIRLDGAYLQSKERRELSKVLISLGAAYRQDSELIATAGWLNRYHYEDFNVVGEQGDHFDQFSLGMHWGHAIIPRADGMKPGVRLSLEGLYYNVSSEIVYNRWETLIESDNVNTCENTYLWEYALGGGQQSEALLGLEFGWPMVTLQLQGGYRGKEYEKYLGHAKQTESDPKGKVRLTFHDIADFRLVGFLDWDPDLTIAGAETSRTLIGPLSLLARAEFVNRDQMLDEARCFLGLRLMFPHKKAALGISSSGKKRSEPGKDLILGHWLQPVEGTATDHLMVLRKLTRRTLVTQTDITPDPFTFVDCINRPLSTLHISNAVSITGINAPVSISISGNATCEYDINGGGSWTSAPGTVNNTDSVEVRQTSSASFGTTTDCTLSCGCESDTYSVTTQNPPPPDEPDEPPPPPPPPPPEEPDGWETIVILI